MDSKIACHLSTVHPLYDPRIFYKECKSLAKAGYQVHLVVPHHHDEIIEGIHIHGLPLFRNRLARIFIGPFRAYFKARKTNAVIFHLHDPELFLVGTILWLSGKKVIFDVHENIREQLKMKEWLPARRMISWLYGLIDFFSARFFYLLLAEHSYADNYRRFTKNYEIILNTPDIAFFEKFYPAENRLSNHLFYIGVISESRCILQILEALSKMQEEVNEVYFHCIGPYSKSLMEKIVALPFYPQIKNRVKFYGRLTPEQGYQISTRCSAGLALLMPVGNYVESYPTKIFEYMSIGMPFITSDFKLYKEIVEEEQCGLCVDPSDVNAIAKAMVRLLSDRELALNMGRSGRRAAINKFHWGVEEKKLLSVYNQLIEKS